MLSESTNYSRVQTNCTAHTHKHTICCQWTVPAYARDYTTTRRLIIRLFFSPFSKIFIHFIATAAAYLRRIRDDGGGGGCQRLGSTLKIVITNRVRVIRSFCHSAAPIFFVAPSIHSICIIISHSCLTRRTEIFLLRVAYTFLAIKPENKIERRKTHIRRFDALHCNRHRQFRAAKDGIPNRKWNGERRRKMASLIFSVARSRCARSVTDSGAPPSTEL